MIYPLIAGYCGDLPTVTCCRVMKVSISGFYEWQHSQSDPAPRTVDDQRLTGMIIEVWRQSRGIYGSPRI